MLQADRLHDSVSRAQRGVMRQLPAATVAAVLALLASGQYRSLSRLGLFEIGAALSLFASAGFVIWRRLRMSRAGASPSMRDDLELGATVIASAYLVLPLVGHAAFWPAIYLVMAFLVTFLPRATSFTLVGVATVFDAIVTLGGIGTTQTKLLALASHVLFLTLFAALFHFVLSGRLALARRAENQAVKNRIKEVEERARTFRLVASGTQDSFPGEQDQEKWLLASVKEIEGAVGAALAIAELALHTHTCAVFLLSSDDRTLKLYDCRSASERVQRERFTAGEGILGGVLKRGLPVRMASALGLKGVTYYDASGPDIRSLLCVPIVEGSGLVRGVLVADRAEPTAFTDNDERLLATAAGEVLRSIEVERVMNYIRKSRDEKDRFFHAIEELNRAGSPEQVFLAVLESARQIAGLDFCAVTLVSEEGGKRVHRIARMTGVTSVGRGIEGATFEDNNGLVANVVRYGAPLPGRDVQAMDRQIIFDDEIRIRGLAALKIFPLQAGDRILGTLVAGSRQRAALDHEMLRMLEVIAIQAAQAVLRAQLFEQMEKMATTDGLTGLTNHRTFQTRFDEALAQARRYNRKCSVLLTDVDHFKSVNDTYGHPIGDVVLKGVARILRQKARDTDIVARYGGEEFAVVMPETDMAGAEVIAERIREAIQSEIFQTELGPLKVTLSIGVATFPESADAKAALIELADGCLYHAKRHGRNQVVTVKSMQSGSRKNKTA